MVARAWATLACLLLAGCSAAGGPSGGEGTEVPESHVLGDRDAPHSIATTGHSPRQRDAPPAPGPAPRPFLLYGTMELRYVADDGALLLVRMRPARVMDAFGAEHDGHVLSTRIGNGSAWHVGLGPCRTPLWVHAENGRVDFVPEDASRIQFVAPFPLLRTVEAAPRPNLAIDGFARDPVPRSPHSLGVALAGGGLAAAWVTDKTLQDGTVAPHAWGSWIMQPVAAGEVPDWVRPPTFPWYWRNDVTYTLDRDGAWASGAPLASCRDFAAMPPPPMQPVTDRATPADPPLPWALNAMIALAESRPELSALQAWKEDPDAAIYHWWGWRAQDQLVPTGPEWRGEFHIRVLYGNPKAGTALWVGCTRPVMEAELPVADALTECGESPYPTETHDGRAPMPALRPDTQVIDYGTAAGIYRKLYGLDPCDLRLALWDPVYDLDLELGCVRSATLTFAPEGGHMRFLARAVGPFVQPPL